MNKTWLSAFFCLFLSMNVAAQASKTTLCQREEIMIASCQIDENLKRILSICSSGDRKSIAYRFGTKSKIEMEVDFSRHRRVSRWDDSWTHTIHFGFKIGEYGYILGVPQETYGAKAFLDVTKGDTLIKSSQCLENSFGEKALLSEAIVDIPDAAVRDSGFIFPPKLD
jgi:hypothetical protein